MASNGMSDPASWYSIGPQRVVTNGLLCATRLVARLMSLSKRYQTPSAAIARTSPTAPATARRIITIITLMA